MKNKKKNKTKKSNKIFIIIFLVIMGMLAYLFLKQLELQNIKVDITKDN